MLNGNIQALFDFIQHIGICILDDGLKSIHKTAQRTVHN